MIKIRLAECSDVSVITELLNEVTLYLHNKGINQWILPWEKGIIEVDIKEGFVYLLEADNIAAGTFSIKDTNDISVNIIYPDNKYLYRIAVLPEYHGKGIGSEIVKYSIQYLRRQNKALYLDCWAGNNKLKAFYAGEGFELIGEVPEEDYLISVFKTV